MSSQFVTIITVVRGFVEMTRFFLNQEGVKFLYSERFCQDPLEAFFGQQRAKGGHNDSPTVKQFCENSVTTRTKVNSTKATTWKLPKEANQH